MAEKFKNINISEFEEVFNSEESIIIDIRDKQSFLEGHIPIRSKHTSVRINPLN